MMVYDFHMFRGDLFVSQILIQSRIRNQGKQKPIACGDDLTLQQLVSLAWCPAKEIKKNVQSAKMVRIRFVVSVYAQMLSFYYNELYNDDSNPKIEPIDPPQQVHSESVWSQAILTSFSKLGVGFEKLEDACTYSERYQDGLYKKVGQTIFSGR